MSESETDFPRAGFIRRLAAMLYDILVATAVFMVAGILITVTLIILLENDVLDKLGQQHSMDVIGQSVMYSNIIFSWSSLWVLGFFMWFWRNGGQTIGMRAWRLRLFTTNDKPMTYARTFLRIIFSLGGLGTLLVLFDIKHKQSLQDRIASTEMLVLSKQANDHKSW